MRNELGHFITYRSEIRAYYRNNSSYPPCNDYMSSQLIYAWIYFRAEAYMYKMLAPDDCVSFASNERRYTETAIQSIVIQGIQRLHLILIDSWSMNCICKAVMASVKFRKLLLTMSARWFQRPKSHMTVKKHGIFETSSIYCWH